MTKPTDRQVFEFIDRMRDERVNWRIITAGPRLCVLYDPTPPDLFPDLEPGIPSSAVEFVRHDFQTRAEAEKFVVFQAVKAALAGLFKPDPPKSEAGLNNDVVGNLRALRDRLHATHIPGEHENVGWHPDGFTVDAALEDMEAQALRDADARAVILGLLAEISGLTPRDDTPATRSARAWLAK
jgi:hypothetical protein